MPVPANTDNPLPRLNAELSSPFPPGSGFRPKASLLPVKKVGVQVIFDEQCITRINWSHKGLGKIGTGAVCLARNLHQYRKIYEC
jgi:hypothetical protein